MTTIILGQISKRKYYEAHYGPLSCYTMTVKSLPGIENIACLTPTKELVYGHKGYQGYEPLDDDAYTERYIGRLNAHMRQIRLWYRALAAQETVLLCCFCRKGAFCHRKIVYALFGWLNSRLDLSYTLILE